MTRHVAEALPFLRMTLDEFRVKGALLENELRTFAELPDAGSEE